MREIVLILDNIRSVHNVGSIFRTADAFAVSKIYCLGHTPTPLDRFGRVRADFAKVSLGAEKTTAWEKVDDLSSLVEALKRKNYFFLALEQGKKAVPFSEMRGGEKIALIVGNELKGVSKYLLSRCDAMVEIPMLGSKESLNVSVATGIALAALQKSIQ